MIWAEWEKIGEPMPFAVVQGGDPGVPMVGGMPIPAEMDEGTADSGSRRNTSRRERNR
jgi:UbiD family decarboxylase